MKNYYKYMVLLLFLLPAAACNKYLDVQPKGYTLLTSATDYDQWLNNVALTSDPGILDINIMGDNYDNPTLAFSSAAPQDLIYLWSPQFELDASVAPPMWGQFYASINYFNTVINGVGSATGGSTAQIRSLKAEALLGRAFEYLYLVNLYGKEYDSSSAASDLAVPFVTANDVTTSVPPRITVQALYNQIFTDLNNALPDLPASNSKNRFRGAVAAAYSVMARACLYKRDYAGAEKNAMAALNADPTLAMYDYNGSTAMANLPDPANSPESIYARSAGYDYDPALTSNPSVTTFPSLTFLQSFDSNDLRLPYYYDQQKTVIVFGTVVKGSVPLTAPPYDFTIRGSVLYIYYSNSTATYNTYTNSGTSVPEMKLVIAEGAARGGDLSTALQQLNDVRKARIATAGYTPYQSSNRDSVLQKVLAERSFELPYVGIRWFDMRRLSVEGRMPTISRINGGDTVMATLAPNGARYTLQIPTNILNFNPGMPQNP